MGENLVYKILKNHIVEGSFEVGKPIGLKIDQTLTQDSTGTMVYLQLEAMNIDKVKTKRSVAFVDHNMLQQGFENADDHKFTQTVASKYGIYCSKPGNGECHQVFLESQSADEVQRNDFCMYAKSFSDSYQFRLYSSYTHQRRCNEQEMILYS